MRTYITLVLVIIIGILSLWFQEGDKQQREDIGLPSERLPDYFMDNFSVTNLDESGQVNYILYAAKMFHFADDDSAELEQPVIKFKQNDQSYTLQATRAIYQKSENLVHLHDKVIIHRESAQQKNELFIYTDYLKVDTMSKVAENNHPSRIKTPQAELNAIGLLLDNSQAKLILKSQVKGVYKNAP
jgi:lipopolysaccharide export system protein LptC